MSAVGGIAQSHAVSACGRIPKYSTAGSEFPPMLATLCLKSRQEFKFCTTEIMYISRVVLVVVVMIGLRRPGFEFPQCHET